MGFLNRNKKNKKGIFTDPRKNNEKIVKIINHLYSEVDRAQKKVSPDIDTNEVKRIINIHKNEPMNKVFGKENHANFSTNKGRRVAEFCGPGTFVEKRLIRGDRGMNSTDALCLKHDIDYRRASKGDFDNDEKIKIIRESDKDLSKGLNTNFDDFWNNRLKVKTGMMLKKFSEDIGVIALDKYITKNVPQDKFDEFEYINELVNIVNQVEEGKLLVNILKKPNKFFINFLLKLHKKELKVFELGLLIKNPK